MYTYTRGCSPRDLGLENTRDRFLSLGLKELVLNIFSRPTNLPISNWQITGNTKTTLNLLTYELYIKQTY